MEEALVSTANCLVTGMPRGGTTFVGRCIGFSPEVNYVWEPFNIVFRKNVPDYYPYIGASSPPQKRENYARLIDETIHFKKLQVRVIENESDSPAKKLLKRIGINRTYFNYKWAEFKYRFLNPKLSLFKDPYGIFLSRYLIEEFSFKIICVVRHPAAVYKSFERLEWKFGNFFDYMRRQNDLYEDFFEAVDSRMQKYEHNPLVDLSFGWLAVLSFMDKVWREHPQNVLMTRHEDLCNEPENEFGKLFEFLELNYTSRINNMILNVTNGAELEAKSTVLSSLEKRNARLLVDKWKDEVSADELNTIREITGEVSNQFYTF
jgi:hypothetical protein